MYKAAVRWMITRNIEALNRGDHAPALAMFDDEARLTFPGSSTFSSEFRDPKPGRTAYATHRGRTEIERFLQRYVAAGLQMHVEDVLVNGAPWKARAMVRAHVWSPGPDGDDRYNNRAVLAVQTRWGKIVRQEDYEDTERASAFDALLIAAEADAGSPTDGAPATV
jgi:ketosteroid isomerase-like protein